MKSETLNITCEELADFLRETITEGWTDHPDALFIEKYRAIGRKMLAAEALYTQLKALKVQIEMFRLVVPPGVSAALALAEGGSGPEDEKLSRMSQ